MRSFSCASSWAISASSPSGRRSKTHSASTRNARRPCPSNAANPVRASSSSGCGAPCWPAFRVPSRSRRQRPQHTLCRWCRRYCFGRPADDGLILTVSSRPPDAVRSHDCGPAGYALAGGPVRASCRTGLGGTKLPLSRPYTAGTRRSCGHRCGPSSCPAAPAPWPGFTSIRSSEPPSRTFHTGIQQTPVDSMAHLPDSALPEPFHADTR